MRVNPPFDHAKTLLQVELPEGFSKFEERVSAPNGINEEVEPALFLPDLGAQRLGGARPPRGPPHRRPQPPLARSRARRSLQSFRGGRSIQNLNLPACAACHARAASSDPCNSPSPPLRPTRQRFRGRLPGSRQRQVQLFHADQVACKRRARGPPQSVLILVGLNRLPVSRHCKTHPPLRASGPAAKVRIPALSFLGDLSRKIPIGYVKPEE